jgi:hypothetical protein
VIITAEEVAHRLGLLPWAEFEATGRTCRTTKMLCRAIAASADGRHVLIAGHDAKYTDTLVTKARWMANAAGVEGVISAYKNQKVDDPGLDEPRPGPDFIDHYDVPLRVRAAWSNKQLAAYAKELGYDPDAPLGSPANPTMDQLIAGIAARWGTGVAKTQAVLTP